MTRNLINKSYNLRSNSEKTINPSLSLDGAHWNNSNLDDVDNNDADDNSANMTEENTTEMFDPDLEHFIITILEGKKDDSIKIMNSDKQSKTITTESANLAKARPAWKRTGTGRRVTWRDQQDITQPQFKLKNGLRGKIGIISG
jgi:hypothetical protein